MEELRPFGPSVCKFAMPDTIIDVLNTFAEQVINDEQQLKQHDISNTLAGKVTHEYAVPPAVLNEYLEFFISCAQQYYASVKERRPDALPNDKLLVGVSQAWINSMFPGDFNPAHHHQGQCQLVGTGFLKMPNMSLEHEKEAGGGQGDISTGCLELIHGQAEMLCPHQLRIIPKVGDFYMWPAGILHTVYPYRTDGERRSFAINITVKQVSQS